MTVWVYFVFESPASIYLCRITTQNTCGQGISLKTASKYLKDAVQSHLRVRLLFLIISHLKDEYAHL